MKRTPALPVCSGGVTIAVSILIGLSPGKSKHIMRKATVLAKDNLGYMRVEITTPHKASSYLMRALHGPRSCQVAEVSMKVHLFENIIARMTRGSANIKVENESLCGERAMLYGSTAR